MNKKSTFSIRNIVKQITPPIIFSTVKKNIIYRSVRKYIVEKMAYNHVPSWVTLTKGELAGCELLVDPQVGIATSMITGDYDAFFVNYLKKLDLSGKIIFDIGAHIGFDTLFFAKSIGQKGKVFAFEPNTANKERLDYIIARNSDLSSRIHTYPFAVSNKKGKTEFFFDTNVDGGTSSGSFIDDANTIWEKSIYEREIGYTRTIVETFPLDEMSSIGITEIPTLIKIDVEGAEYLVIEGAKNLLKKHHPILFIEIHSIFNMLKVGEDIRELGYKIELLKEETDGRCFIVATYNN